MSIREEKKLLTALSKRVKELRNKKGVTQEQAYNDTGIHFGRIEQGRRDASFLTLNKICEYFEINLEEFFKDGFKSSK
ncbi:MAG: hypothetical protein Tsb0033_15340 [Winogradskyella sp.]